MKFLFGTVGVNSTSANLPPQKTQSNIYRNDQREEIVNSEAIVAAAARFGLTAEMVAIADTEEAFKVYKGANQIFVGRAADIATFLVDYEKNLPGLYEGSIYGYQE